MKRLCSLLFILFSFQLLSSAQTVITYNYDAAGNRATRTATSVVACVDALHIGEISEIPDLDSEHDLQKSSNYLNYSLASNNGEVRSSELEENSYMNDRSQHILYSADSSINRAQMLTIKQKQI